mgnify:CR=1
MPDAEKFALINRQCACIARLIEEAERLSNKDQAECLYKIAARLTDGIIENVQEQLIPLESAFAELENAA